MWATLPKTHVTFAPTATATADGENARLARAWTFVPASAGAVDEPLHADTMPTAITTAVVSYQPNRDIIGTVLPARRVGRRESNTRRLTLVGRRPATPHAADRDRFETGIEESDDIFGALVEALVGRGVVRDPLLVVTSDHGQSFGALGYHSHGSAVVRDQITVPLLLHHPRLAAGAVASSSHFDVLPTVLDLLGVADARPGRGSSLCHPDRTPPSLLVWAGHPSRTTTTNYGFVVGDDKYMIDLALDRCLHMDLDDRRPRELCGEEREYVTVLASRLMTARGVA